MGRMADRALSELRREVLRAPQDPRARVALARGLLRYGRADEVPALVEAGLVDHAPDDALRALRRDLLELAGWPCTLSVLVGDEPTTLRVRVADVGRLTIGRGPHSVLVLHAPTVARTHAGIFVDAARGFVVVDAGSYHGVLVDERRIREEEALGERHRLHVGGVELEFRAGWSDAWPAFDAAQLAARLAARPSP